MLVMRVPDVPLLAHSSEEQVLLKDIPVIRQGNNESSLQELSEPMDIVAEILARMTGQLTKCL